MQIINDPKLDFKDVLIVPQVSHISSRADVRLSRKFKWIGPDGNEHTWTGIPIIASNMDGVGTFDMAAIFNSYDALVAITKHESTNLERWKHLTDNPTLSCSSGVLPLPGIYSIGMPQRKDREQQLRDLFAFYEDFPSARFLCIDVANGYNSEFVHWIQEVRSCIPPNIFIMAGNVVTPSQTEQLILSGANAVKIGIGSGSVCTTRKVTGVGYPQLSAIIECAHAAHGLNGFIVSDGGCQTPGDVAKAFAAGADFVMLGGMLAGHDESECEFKFPPEDGPKADKKRRYYTKFHGSSSKAAQKLHSGELADYRSSEGKEVRVLYRGPVANTMAHILGGLRSTCTYVGAGELKDLSKRTIFVRVTNQYNTVFGDDSEVT